MMMREEMLMVAEADAPAMVTNTKVTAMMTPMTETRLCDYRFCRSGGHRPIKARRNTGHCIVAGGSCNRRSEANRCSERY